MSNVMGVYTQEQRDGLSSRILCGKDTPTHSRDWAKPVSTKTEDIEYHLLDSMCKVERRQDGLMS